MSSSAAWAQTTLINETFEGATNSFTVVNGTATNAWIVGTGATNGPTTTGTKAAYISNDAGVTHAYTNTAISVVHMYQDVTFPAGQTIIQLALDWKGLGESSTTYDNLQLFLIPTTVTPAASATGALGSNSRLQNSSYTPFATLTGQSTYSRTLITIPASMAGTTQRLVFQWYDDASGGSNPPAAVDNVLLTTATAVPVCGTKSVGPTGDYASLTAAFAAVGLNGVCGPLLLELQATYVSSVETFPIAYNYTGATATNTVTVRPAAGATGLSITGTGATAVFNIVGGKYLTLDGRPGGSGSTVSGAAATTDLTIASTSTSGIPLQFTSDASFNTVQHVQIKGVGTSDSGSPDVNFTGTVTTTGNSDNTVQYCNIGDGATTPVTLVYGGSTLNSRNSILNNNLFNNYSTASTYGIYLNQAGTAWTITGNSFYQTASRVNVSGTMYGIYVAGGGHTITGNFIGGSAPTAGGTALTSTLTAASVAATYRFAGIYLTTSGTATSVQGNTVANINWVSSSGATTTYGIVSGIYVSAGDANIGTTTGNVIGTVAGPITVSTTTAAGYAFGISTASSGTVSIVGNTISNYTGVGSPATIASNVAGILASAGTANTIRSNKIYNLAAGSGGNNLSTGIWLTGGTTNTVVNNLIGDLRAATSTSLVAVSGILVAGGTTDNVYFNTINLAATSTGATFGTSGIYLNSTTAALDLRNNIVVNKSTAVGTGGYTVALRRVSGTAGTAPGNLAATTNNNLYYAGTPSATNLIYVEGTTTATNAQQTLNAYKLLVANRDINSVTEDVAFVSTTGTAATFLHINTTTPTQVEGNGTPIAGITTDFDGDIRNATTPDLGADEGTFVPLDLSGPTITYTALGSTPSTANRTLAVTISDPSGVATGTNAPRLYYRKGTSGAYAFVNATTVSGSTYTFTFDYAAIGGVAGFDVVQYYVAAQDVPGNASTSPFGGSGATPPGTTAPATINQFLIQGALSGIYYVGTSTSPVPARTYATLTAAIAAYNTNTLGGAVTFVLLDGTYSTAETFPIVLNANADASATNTLTIKPNTGVTALVSGSVATGAVVKFNGADYVIIDGSNAAAGTTRDLTIENTSATGTGNAVVWLAAASATDGASFNTVKNAVVRGNATGFPQFTMFLGGGGAGVTAPTTSTPAANSNNTISNNLIQKGFYGVFVFGVSATALDQSNVISNNQLGQGTGNGFGQEGIRAVYQQSLLIERNEIQNLTNATTTANMYGIFLADSKGATVSRNSVHNIGYTGTSTTKVWAINTSMTAFITAANPSNTLLSNNLVYNINSTSLSSTWNTVGINLGGGYGDQIYYNTVYLSGQLSGATGTAGSAAFANGNPSVVATATNIDVRNNIFSIIGGTAGTATTPLYAHYTQGTTYTGSTLNYNDLYVTVGATGLARIGRINAVDAATLADWRTATTQEANSVSADPGFIQTATVPFDLTPTAATLNGVAAPVAIVTVDYTGATRSTTPDIGAYEFTPPNCQAATALAISSITATSASLTFTAPTTGSSASNYTVTFTPTGGTATTVTPAPTGSPVALTNLTPSTTYTVTVMTNCTGGIASPNATVTFTTACAPPTYATLPVSETFESTWLSRCDTREVPTANWLNTPTTGNNSWRRDDDGVAAVWTLPTSGAFTPAGSQGSAHSARFHSYYAASGAVGTFDLYANLSTAGTKRLTFDFVNVSTAGSKIDVLLSTDGGVTFGTTPLLTLTTAATFTAQTLDLTATSATSVIRFKATSDFGSYDIGMDNVQLRILPAIDLAATALATPTSTQGCYGSAETVAVTVTNQGAQALDFSVNPATVTAVVTTPGGPQTLTGSISTGTLAAGANQNVTLAPTLNMTAAGTYTFAITATVTGDGNTANDLLAPAPTRTVAAPVAGTLAASSASLCVSGTTVLTLTGALNGGIQLQSSSDNVTFTAVAGATSTTYTTPVLTQTTYYRTRISCNTNSATSNVVTVTVNNPLVATTNGPVNICAGNTATLTATASTGANIRFFGAATGGTALATATAGTYTTPALTANTTYYAEAYMGGTESVGPTAQTSTGLTAQTGGALYFTTTSALTISAVTVYLSAGQAAGTVTIDLRAGNSTSGAIVNSQNVAFAVPAGPATGVAPYVVPLNYSVPAAGQYTLYLSAASQGGLLRDNAGANPTSYPYTSPSGNLSITAPNTATYYYYFYNWQVSSECAGAARTAIQVNVAPLATASFPAATAATCGTSAYSLAGTVGGSATSGTYTSSGTGTFSPNATTLNATYTPSAADVTAGSVTITLTSTGPCAAVTATLALSISPAPVATFSYPATGNCAGSGAVSPTLGTGATAGTFTSTTGLTLNATTGAVNLATSTAGTYTVTNTVAASGSCGAATATASITVNLAAVANAGANQAICSGATATLGSAALTGYTYSWAPATGLSSTTAAQPTVTLTNTTGAATTTVYTVTATTATGCTATAQVTITVNPRPATPVISATYNGTTTTLTSSATTGNQFYLGGVAITGATGQTYVVNGTPAQLGSYTVVTTSAAGCTSLPSLPLVVTAAKNGIAGASLKLYPNPTPTGQVSLELTGFRSTTQLTVLDPLGRVVVSELLPANAGTATHTINLTGVATGVYLLRLSNADGVETRRLVRE